jgi:hypothetical protein
MEVPPELASLPAEALGRGAQAVQRRQERASEEDVREQRQRDNAIRNKKDIILVDVQKNKSNITVNLEKFRGEFEAAIRKSFEKLL